MVIFVFVVVRIPLLIPTTLVILPDPLSLLINRIVSTHRGDDERLSDITEPDKANPLIQNKKCTIRFVITKLLCIQIVIKEGEILRQEGSDSRHLGWLHVVRTG